ncbi:sepiapterin reductase-like [Diadema antillarum]|uniref:sepiapterin reductase-like n=1 Tax=Diadema antillarum TaxID=105358 RepID=UPI003A8745EF
MASSEKILSSKTFCIITGGSRGIGRAIALAISKQVEENSVVVITGRSAGDLNETQNLVHAATPGVQVIPVTADLSDQSALSNTLQELTKDVTPENYQHALLVNNAGSLGDTTRYSRDLSSSDVESLQNYCMLNLTSAFLLTSHFLSKFSAREGLRRTVINITSLAAIQPMSSCGLYCMGKAARDMWFKTLASEEPDARILNYAPGPVETDMFQHMSTKSADDGLRESLVGLVTSQKVLKPDQTAAKLVRLLEEDTFESGAHIDYFDFE